MLSNYPDGVFDWTPNAPWNDSEPDDMEFECEVMETLSRNVGVSTHKYNEYFERDEDTGYGYGGYDTDDVDWGEEYDEQYDSLADLLLKVKDFLSEHVNVGTLNNKGRELYNAILPQCDGWSVVEREVAKL